MPTRTPARAPSQPARAGPALAEPGEHPRRRTAPAIRSADAGDQQLGIDGVDERVRPSGSPAGRRRRAGRRCRRRRAPSGSGGRRRGRGRPPAAPPAPAAPPPATTSDRRAGARARARAPPRSPRPTPSTIAAPTSAPKRPGAKAAAATSADADEPDRGRAPARAAGAAGLEPGAGADQGQRGQDRLELVADPEEAHPAARVRPEDRERGQRRAGDDVDRVGADRDPAGEREARRTGRAAGRWRSASAGAPSPTASADGERPGVGCRRAQAGSAAPRRTDERQQPQRRPRAPRRARRSAASAGQREPDPERQQDHRVAARAVVEALLEVGDRLGVAVAARR